MCYCCNLDMRKEKYLLCKLFHLLKVTEWAVSVCSWWLYFSSWLCDKLCWRSKLKHFDKMSSIYICSPIAKQIYILLEDKKTKLCTFWHDWINTIEWMVYKWQDALSLIDDLTAAMHLAPFAYFPPSNPPISGLLGLCIVLLL